MKKYIKSLLICFMATVIVGCSKDAITPEVSFTVDNPNPQVGETITFTVTGGADTYVIYTGDPSHEYSKSYLAVIAGQDPDQELMVLTADSLTTLRPWLNNYVESYNSSIGSGESPLDIDAIIADLGTVVSKEYTNKLSAAYEAYLFMPELGNQVATNMIDLYYEDHSVLLAPEGGFSTGIAINRYETTYTYAYNDSGTFTATLIATNVSDKQYSGSGYQDGRSSSADEYDINRANKELVISVQP